MKKRIKNKMKDLIPLNELKEKRKKKIDKKREDYHKFYARSSMPETEWQALQVKAREHKHLDKI